MQVFDITNLWHSFTLPRRTKWRIAACALCFFLFYGLFYAVLYGQTLSETYIIQWTQQAKAYGMSMDPPKVQFFPPSISIPSVQITGKNTNQLSLRNLHASLNVFSDTITFEAKTLGGTLQGSATLSSLFSPEWLQLHIQADAIAMPELISFAGLRQSGALIQILEGTLKGTLTADIPMKKEGKALNLVASTGSLQMTMENTTITHGLPLLVASHMENLLTEIELAWDARKIHIQQVRITNPILYANFDGSMTANTIKPLDSTIDIRAVLRMPLDQLHEEFVPPRTLRALRENEQVRMDLTNNLRNPKVQVKL